jgi:hypothetical protein
MGVVFQPSVISFLPHPEARYSVLKYFFFQRSQKHSESNETKHENGLDGNTHKSANETDRHTGEAQAPRGDVGEMGFGLGLMGYRNAGEIEVRRVWWVTELFFVSLKKTKQNF